MGLGSVLSKMVGAVQRAGSDLTTSNSAFFGFAESLAPEGRPALHPSITGGGILINPLEVGGSGAMVKLSVRGEYLNANDLSGRGIGLIRGGRNRNTTEHVVFSSKADAKAAAARAERGRMPEEGVRPDFRIYDSQPLAIRAASRAFAEQLSLLLPKADQPRFIEQARGQFLIRFKGFEAEWPAPTVTVSGWKP